MAPGKKPLVRSVNDEEWEGLPKQYDTTPYRVWAIVGVADEAKVKYFGEAFTPFTPEPSIEEVCFKLVQEKLGPFEDICGLGGLCDLAYAIAEHYLKYYRHSHIRLLYQFNDNCGVPEGYIDTKNLEGKVKRPLTPDEMKWLTKQTLLAIIADTKEKEKKREDLNKRERMHGPVMV